MTATVGCMRSSAIHAAPPSSSTFTITAMWPKPSSTPRHVPCQMTSLTPPRHHSDHSSTTLHGMRPFIGVSMCSAWHCHQREAAEFQRFRSSCFYRSNNGTCNSWHALSKVEGGCISKETTRCLAAFCSRSNVGNSRIYCHSLFYCCRR